MASVSLSAIAILSALFFGSVYPWSMAIIAFLAVVTFIYFLWSTKDDTAQFTNEKGIIFAALLLFSYPLFQLVPLPVSLLNLLHPKFRDLMTISPNEVPSFHSISVYPFATEMEICRLFIYLTVFIVASFGIKDEEGVTRVMKVLVVFGFVLGLFAVIQHATWNGKIYWIKKPFYADVLPFGPFVNKNHYAGFMEMIIPLSLGLSLRSRRNEKKLLFAFLGITMAVTLFFSLSRAGMISFLAGMIVFSVLVLGRGMSRKKLIPVALFALIVAGYLLFLGISPIIARFTPGEVSTGNRISAWMGTLSAFRDYAFLGSGFGTFQYIFKIYQPDGLYLYWAHAHNDYLQLLLELGIAGTIVVAVFLFVVLKTIIKAEWGGGDLYLKAALLSSISSIAVHSIVDFNLHIPSNGLLFFLILGLGVSLSRNRMEDKRLAKR
ncbi:MAG TPA: O-antigen ligase family protein [Thermodesulfovibrionales bacterium]|nr:O-antigen ligase family protein [Thermodesulfovibrionales bacterium]